MTPLLKVDLTSSMSIRHFHRAVSVNIFPSWMVQLHTVYHDFSKYTIAYLAIISTGFRSVIKAFYVKLMLLMRFFGKT